ncbi:hypothetical protein DLD82_04465 [Methanospirillum stamsii]|uniref:Uncharacterized protein n=2 Tax=Methanospirillum stamsii TaxID=1277351 RepID=A0A2V2NCQ7_9EURY|nr:hypothetical protein DLD82_04465 [Methanospirillum stamsii]
MALWEMVMPGEPCFSCRAPSVYSQQYSGKHLCERHLAEDIVIRVKRTIRLQGGLGKKSVIAVIHDGPGFIPLLHILGSVVSSRPGMKMMILEPDSEDSLYNHDFSFLPSSIQTRVERGMPESFMEIAIRGEADRIIRSATLDEEASQVLGSLLSGDSSFFMKSTDTASVICLTPLCEIPMAELAIYSRYTNLPFDEAGLPESGNVRGFLTALSNNHPSVPFSLLKYRDRLRDLGQ